MKNLKVKMKLIVSFVIVIALALFVGAIGIIGMFMINKADEDMYNGNYLPTVVAGKINAEIITQRVMIRNFVVYDITIDAAQFQTAANELAQSRKTMDSLLAEYKGTIDDKEDQNAYDQLVKLYNGDWKTMVDKIEVFGQNNQTQDAKAALIESSAVAADLKKAAESLQQVNMESGSKAVDGNTSLFMTMTIIEVAMLAFSVVIAFILVFYIAGLIAKPLAVLTAFMNKAGTTGDISLQPEDERNIAQYSHVKDEIGQCISSTSRFIVHMTTVAGALETVANGDLTGEIRLLSDQDTMGVSLQKMTTNLNNMFGEINASTAQVSTGSKQIADGAQALAQGSTEQAAAVEQLSSSITEIAEKTKENAGMAERAANLANTIKGNAEKGSRQMDEMTTAVKEINEASQSINKVIKVIDDIAFQTNILALNAAVEAARAGQHGKGFAVVAEEVRSLAAKSAEAAKDTGSLIANSMEKAELGARIADETAASLTEIVSGINESSRLVGDIARSSEEQSLGISQINKGIDQVAQVIQQNSATAEESAAASEEMSGQANMLEELIGHFRIKDDNRRRIGSSGGGSPKRLAMPEKLANAEDGFGKY